MRRDAAGALKYAATLDIPFVFSSNGNAFLFHDRTGRSGQMETELPLDAFPSPAKLWDSYRAWKGLTPKEEEVVLQDYYEDRHQPDDRGHWQGPGPRPSRHGHQHEWLRVRLRVPGTSSGASPTSSGFIAVAPDLISVWVPTAGAPIPCRAGDDVVKLARGLTPPPRPRPA